MERKKLIIVSGIILLVLIVAGLSAYFLLRPKAPRRLQADYTFPIAGNWDIATSSAYGNLEILSTNASTTAPFQNTEPTFSVIERRLLEPSVDPVMKAGSIAAYASSVKNSLVPTFYAGHVSDYVLIEDKPVTLPDGTKAYIIGNSYSVTLPPQNNASSTSSVMNFRTLNLFAIKNGNFFIVTASADQADWSKYQTNFNTMLSGFKLQ